MLKGIIGRKLGMTQVFGDNGNVIPITVIEAGPCAITQIKTKEKEGYNALQLGFMKKKPQRVNRPLSGHFQKSGTGPFYFLKEFRVDESGEYTVGQEITLETFTVGDVVDITGISKGRGFAGVIKRHGFRGSHASHGTHEYFRHGGSIGSNTFPGRTFKGKRMPGHYGNSRVTVQNFKIIDIKPENNLLLIKGAIPGSINSIVIIREATKKGAPREERAAANGG
ncbi:MAG: 50S ribosomal protein L3 [Deltaproteobacteria bacterium RBG_13_52_11]|nr:MAG: 50S ribosomal protein L3 [Deltaproteobacteria bacterium RBG_13_52_11]